MFLKNIQQFVKTKGPWKNPKDIILVALGIVFTSFIVFYPFEPYKNQSKKAENDIIFRGGQRDLSNNCPIDLISGDGTRIYLSNGALVVWKERQEKVFYVVKATVHFTPEQFKKIKCYDSKKTAITDGYAKEKILEISLSETEVDKIVKTSYPCVVDLYLDEASIKLKGDQKALDILKDECLWLLDSKIYDFDGDKKNEIAMVATGAGCGSCEYNNRIYIVKNGNIIFQRDELMNPDFWPIKDSPGFIIKYPIEKDGEGTCVPSEGIIERYEATDSDSDEFFRKSAQWIESYNIKNYPQDSPCILKYANPDRPFFYQGILK